MQIFHADHGNLERLPVVFDFEMADVKTHDPHCGTFRQSFRQFLPLKAASHPRHFADVINSLSILHADSVVAALGQRLSAPE